MLKADLDTVSWRANLDHIPHTQSSMPELIHRPSREMSHTDDAADDVLCCVGLIVQIIYSEVH